MEIKSRAEQIILTGNNIDSLKKYPDNFFDSIVTDPPYGLGKEPNAEEMLRAWITEGYMEVKGTGFMGKEWDAFVPQPIFWKEVFRVLKHGGHVVSFFGTRTYDWGVMSMRLAGFEVRDCIQWIYGSGFPKSHNISKAIDKMYGAEREIIGKANHLNKGSAFNTDKGWNENSLKSPDEVMITAPSTDQAKQWDGWGSALKPANEPIVLARKPLEKGLSIAENVLKWGTGAINIDASKISVSENDKNHRENPSQGNSGENSIFGVGGHNGNLQQDGRFPSNVILTHHPECKCLGLKKVKSSAHHTHKYNSKHTIDNTFLKGLKDGDDFGNKFSDENGEETTENWECHYDCPIKILDEQSGERKAGGKVVGTEPSKTGQNGIYNTYNRIENDPYTDTGGASRFFYVAKASKSERNFGLEGFEEKQTVGGGGITSPKDESGNIIVSGEKGTAGKYGSAKAISTNFHPTVKPVKLMQYLIRMITPPNGTVLDPFSGSGTTGVACKIDGFNFVGLELSEEYSEIARARIAKFVEEKEFIDDCKIFESEKNKIESQYRLFE